MEREEQTRNISFTGSEEHQSRISLLVFHRNGAKVMPLTKGQSVTIGRVPPVDILIPDNTLSRQHAKFELVDDRVIVEDLGSTNGVWFEGQKVTRKSLIPGSEVTMGRITISVHLLGAKENPVHRVTGHDQFFEILAEEVSRAKTFGNTLAVMHVQASQPAGGNVSRWFPKVRKFFRPVDDMALYSSDVLEILMPEIGIQGAQRLAEKINQAQKQEKFFYQFGIAIFPDSAASPDALIESARLAMQQATQKQPIQIVESQGVRSFHHGKLPKVSDKHPPIVQNSLMQGIFESVRRLAQTHIPVLIYGETGTGKEVVAQSIHELSKRRKKCMCCINCAAIPEQLVESILFGHVRGAFTGADRDAKGVFEEADGGTVLLDEIGELPLPAQAKLLRVLETKKVNRVGSARECEVDVRIIAATNRNLEEMCETGKFRSDLFYRINVMTLKVPPLRERADEIPSLVEHFIKLAAQTNNSAARVIEDNALSLLQSYYWPGNVRELRNVIERAVVLARSSMITVDDLPERILLNPANQDPHPIKHSEGNGGNGAGAKASSSGDAPFESATDPENHVLLNEEEFDLRSRMRQFEAGLIRDALKRTGGNQTEAARLLRIPLRTFVRKLKSYTEDE